MINDEIEELTKEVYARFGLTYYFSECLHKQLCHMYALSGFRDRSEVTAPRLQEKLKYSYSLTLGQVAEATKDIVPEKSQSTLERLIKERNFLAHYFWFEKIHLMASIDGLNELISTLSELGNEFSALDKQLEEYFEPTMKRFGIDESMIEATLQEIKAGIPMEPLPNKRFAKKQERIVRAWQIPGPGKKYLIALESEDGTLWQFCDVGLGWCAFDAPQSDWKLLEKIQEHLPATLGPRPLISKPWNYHFKLSGNAVLWVTRNEADSMFKWGIRLTQAE